MKIRNIYYPLSFSKKLKKFSGAEKIVIQKRLKIFMDNPFNPQLKTHKLTGKLTNYWSFSITYHLRIMFEFMDKESVGLVDGTHEIYR